MEYFCYRRRHSSMVRIGDVPMGADHPIRVQSMTNTSTLDVASSQKQVKRIFDAGADYVRLTVQGVREAQALGQIRCKLDAIAYTGPLIADIHFNPRAAQAALMVVEKVRINPGNYVDTRGDDLDDLGGFERGAHRVAERFGAFVQEAKRMGRAIRLGVNHGSLSERMMRRYGDTPEGMVESCMEYLSVCSRHDFGDVVISMKASNVFVMTAAVRLLVERMDACGMAFPLHLGVTEAGDGEDGRIKSAVGIGSLLADGLGDTIRVSLSEAPEREVPVARALCDYITARAAAPAIDIDRPMDYDRGYQQRLDTYTVGGVVGGHHLPIVVADRRGGLDASSDLHLPPDFVLSDELADAGIPSARLLAVNADEMDEAFLAALASDVRVVLLLSSRHLNPVADWRRAFLLLERARVRCPVILHRSYQVDSLEDLRLYAAADFGSLLLEGRGNGLALSAPFVADKAATDRILYGILQATRLRMTRPDYISCPGCGRTLYNLEETLGRIKAATSHLKGLKIGVMGCIVNGPGEMADADYGYVGAAPGRVDLYKSRHCVERGIPEDEAVGRLIRLIKAGGDWQEAE